MPTVERFDLPGVNALNFVLQDSLGGGGTASLRKLGASATIDRC